MAGAVPLFTADFASGQSSCDFVTGGGFIVRPNDAKANFGVAGGCKNGGFFGHLNYIDHGNTPIGTTGPLPFHVHGTSITAYLFTNATTREICGTAETNNPTFPTVKYHVTVTDNGEPGTNDTFIIRLFVDGSFSPIYTTETDPDHTLHGGNIQLHKPNPSTTGTFGGTCPGGGPPPT